MKGFLLSNREYRCFPSGQELGIMKEQVKIRTARPGDLGTLVGFNQEMARETEGKHLDLEILASGVGAVLEDSRRGFYLVAEISGETVGSLMITTEWSDWRNGDFWWFQSVYVQPKWRKLGVFKALHEEARNRAVHASGVCGCRLYVERDNTSAQAVYARRGFQETDYKMFEDLFD